MKRVSIGVLFVSTCTLSTLAGCGGGSSSAGSGNTTPASGSGGTTPTTYSGQFLDAPTKGLSYAAIPSGLSGTTDANGGFSFQAGDTVTFSLDVGSTNALSVGATTLAAPSSGSAKVFVLSLPNGLQVAQVLQSLNHGSTSAMDVSGLTLPAEDVTALNNYVASGGTALPASDATDMQMLYQAQQDSNASTAKPTYVTSGGASVSTTLAALQQTLTQLSASTPVDLSSLLPGKVVFHQGLVSDPSGTQEDFGIDYFNSDGTVSAVSSNTNNTINQGSPAYTTQSNVLTISNAGISDTITISYVDSTQGLWTDSSSDGSSGAGSYVFLLNLKPADIAGKTLSLSGTLGKCGGVPFELVIDASGASFTSNCQNGAPKGSGTIAAAASIPGVLTFTDSSSGSVHYVGLVNGGTLSAGSVAVITTNVASGETATNGIFGLTSK